MIGIYCIENTVLGRAYIGQSSDINKRCVQHKSALRGGYHVNSALQRAWDKYGEDAFEFSVIEEVDEEDLDDAEMMWIAYFDTYISGYNMTIGGSSTRGLTPWNKGGTHSDETKKRLSECAKKRLGEKNPFYGRTHKQSTKSRIRECRSLPVIDIDTGTIFPSAKFADLCFGGRSANVSKALNHKCYTAYGRRWGYYGRREET